MTKHSLSRSVAVVVCLSSDHPTKRAEILMLQRSDRGQWSAGYRGTTHGKDWTGDQILKGDEPTEGGMPREGLEMSEELGLRRRRVRFECPACGRNVTARGERLDAVVEELAEAWAKHPDTPFDRPMVVPLSELAARV